MTRRTPEIRAEELSNQTGLPSEYMVAYKKKVSDCEEAEALIHDRLMRYRITTLRNDRSREFFVLPLDRAISAFNEIATQFELGIVKRENTKSDDEKPSIKLTTAVDPIDTKTPHKKSITPPPNALRIIRDKRPMQQGLEWVAGPDNDMKWNEARSWVQNLALHGKGWRMPTMDELKTLYKKGAGSRNMTPLLKTTGWFVWSGEADGLSFAWSFDFDSGYRRSKNRSLSISFRSFAVRSRNDV